MRPTAILDNSPENGVMHNEAESVPVDANTWDEIVAGFDPKQADALEHIAILREELHGVFSESPPEAIIAEATNFATLYYADRIVPDDNGDSVFFTRDTRNPHSRNLDSVTTIREREGDTTVVVDMVMDYGYDQWFRLTVDTHGTFIVQKMSDSGGWPVNEVHNVQEIGHILNKYVDMSILAASKVRDRSDPDKEAADLDAQDRYYQKIGRPRFSSL